MATIKDVARLAGVSVATVSRVLNGSAAVSAPRRGRVQKAAARLNYSPNVAARSLITNETHTIGVLLPDLFGEFFSEVIRGIDHAAREDKGLRPIARRATPCAGFTLTPSRGRSDPGISRPIVQNPNCVPRTGGMPTLANREAQSVKPRGAGEIPFAAFGVGL